MGTGRLPDFLHLGPGKSGSTWVHETLIHHPQVHLTGAKDLYFFSRYYDRGTQWYAEQFREAGDAPVVGEVCPDYLVSEAAPGRIRETLGPDVRMMVCLREPVDRAFSSFLYARKHGLGPDTFAAAIDQTPEILDEGRYGTQLRRYLRHFDADRLHLTLFDDLGSDPQAYLDGITDWLGIDHQQLTTETAAPVLQASTARFLPLASMAQRGADWVRRHDGAALVGRVKRSPVVQRLLYRPMGEDRPRPSDRETELVRERLAGELEKVESDFGVPVTSLWGWA